MQDGCHCWFKRDRANDGSPKGEWEEGTLYEFVSHDNFGQCAIISAKNDAATVVVPLNAVGIGADNPDKVKEAYEKAEAAKAEAAAKELEAAKSKPVLPASRAK